MPSVDPQEPVRRRKRDREFRVKQDCNNDLIYRQSIRPTPFFPAELAVGGGPPRVGRSGERTAELIVSQAYELMTLRMAPQDYLSGLLRQCEVNDTSGNASERDQRSVLEIGPP